MFLENKTADFEVDSERLRLGPPFFFFFPVNAKNKFGCFTSMETMETVEKVLNGFSPNAAQMKTLKKNL